MSADQTPSASPFPLPPPLPLQFGVELSAFEVEEEPGELSSFIIASLLSVMSPLEAGKSSAAIDLGIYYER